MTVLNLRHDALSGVTAAVGNWWRSSSTMSAVLSNDGPARAACVHGAGTAWPPSPGPCVVPRQPAAGLIVGQAQRGFGILEAALNEIPRAGHRHDLRGLSVCWRVAQRPEGLPGMPLGFEGAPGHQMPELRAALGAVTQLHALVDELHAQLPLGALAQGDGAPGCGRLCLSPVTDAERCAYRMQLAAGTARRARQVCRRPGIVAPDALRAVHFHDEHLARIIQSSQQSGLLAVTGIQRGGRELHANAAQMGDELQRQRGLGFEDTVFHRGCPPACSAPGLHTTAAADTGGLPPGRHASQLRVRQTLRPGSCPPCQDGHCIDGPPRRTCRPILKCQSHRHRPDTAALRAGWRHPARQDPSPDLPAMASRS